MSDFISVSEKQCIYEFVKNKNILNFRLEDPSGKFSIDPVKAVGHTAVSIKVNSKVRLVRFLSVRCCIKFSKL